MLGFELGVLPGLFIDRRVVAAASKALNRCLAVHARDAVGQRKHDVLLYLSRQ